MPPVQEEPCAVCPECSAPIDNESIEEACWLCGAPAE